MPEPNQSAPLLSDSAAQSDALDFDPYTQTLLDIVRDPHTQGPLTIGLFGAWGSGKTSLMNFVHNDLADARKNSGRTFRRAWFDAWKYEKEDALWRALLLRVIDSLRERDAEGKDITKEPLKSDVAKLEQRLYRDVQWEEKGGLTVDWSQLVKGAATGAIKLSFGFLPGLATLTEAVKAAQGEIAKGEDAGKILDAFHRDVIEHHQAQLRSLEQFQKEFGELIQKHIVAHNARLVVFVDDLDRCLPEKAIEVLEAIKLFLDVKGCIFLLGLDQEVITRGIKVKYREFAVDEGDGSEKKIPIDGAAYLEKIIQLPFRLPKIEPRALQPFIKTLAEFPDARCADVFAEGLETNPRKVKRALNVFLFISTLAERRAIPIQAVRLAKVTVIYHSHPVLYESLRLNPALLRDLEAYLREQIAATPRATDRALGAESAEISERATKETATAPIDARLITDSLKRVLTLFLEDDAACFLKADYDELNSYFTLTRGAIAQAPTVATPETVARAALAFPVPTFVRVPAGEFLMGTSDAEIEQLLKMKETQAFAKEWKEKGIFKREQPQHRVTLDEFQIGKYPVTNAEYLAFVKDANQKPPQHWSGGTFAEDLAAHPVVNVSWDDAQAYCEWLTQALRAAKQLRDKEIIRLPTEAEWEKAAAWDDENKTHRFWAWGNEWDAAKCNTDEGKIGTTTPVGKFSPSGDSFYGAADFTGNVWEWCGDWYAENFY
ncbi:MAG: SUMF1/EgtB/PvdO family nonheme iron enzyme, partial [Chloroflexi bacterium]|nr:SUMF1/EgtB/PvdO family nonheme iron enzyme [Chloroflexota bacterium]